MKEIEGKGMISGKIHTPMYLLTPSSKTGRFDKIGTR